MSLFNTRTTMDRLRPGDLFLGWNMPSASGHGCALCVSNAAYDLRFPDGDRLIGYVINQRVVLLRYGSTAGVNVFREQP
jgi:hypothetical protein